jgi:hypothetical protein
VGGPGVLVMKLRAVHVGEGHSRDMPSGRAPVNLVK